MPGEPVIALGHRWEQRTWEGVSVMDSVTSENTSSAADMHVLEVIRAAKQELAELVRQRAEIMRRIGTTKQAILGLANLFGDTALQDELLEFMENRSVKRQPGFTRACRFVLMQANRPLNSREMCEQLWHKHRELAIRHKDLLASVTTVLNRLVGYGEARAIEEPGGRRIWEWIAERESGVPSAPGPLNADPIPEFCGLEGEPNQRRPALLEQAGDPPTPVPPRVRRRLG